MIRFFSLLIVFFSSFPSFAYDFDFSLGSITHHLIVRDDVEKEFKGGIAFNNRMIANALFAIGIRERLEKERYHTLRIFGGQNSIHEAMLGLMLETGKQKHYLDYGFIIGLYGQNNRLYHEKDIDNIAFEVGDLGLIPVVGGAIHVKYPITKKLTLGLSNMITPALTNHSILVRYLVE